MKLDDAGIARDQIGGTFKQYLFNSLKIYSNARYDLTGEVFSEVLVGLKYYPNSDLVLTGEWYQSYPVFDNSSIYSVFAVDRYQEAVFKADYTINDKVTVNAGYTRQIYEEGDDTNVYDIGTRIRPIEKLQLGLDYNYQNGYGGSLNGGALKCPTSPSSLLRFLAVFTTTHTNATRQPVVRLPVNIGWALNTSLLKT